MQEGDKDNTGSGPGLGQVRFANYQLRAVDSWKLFVLQCHFIPRWRGCRKGTARQKAFLNSMCQLHSVPAVTVPVPWVGGKEFWSRLLVTRGDTAVSSDLIVLSSLNSHYFEQEWGGENWYRCKLLTLELSQAGRLVFALKTPQGGHPKHTSAWFSQKAYLEFQCWSWESKDKDEHLGSHEFKHNPQSSGTSFFLESLSNWSQCHHWDPLNQRSPTFRIYCLMICGRADLIVIEIKCTITVMYLNHSRSILPPLVHGKIVFHETGPWYQKGWGPWPKSILFPGQELSIQNSRRVIFLPYSGFCRLKKMSKQILCFLPDSFY